MSSSDITLGHTTQDAPHNRKQQRTMSTLHKAQRETDHFCESKGIMAHVNEVQLHSSVVQVGAANCPDSHYVTGTRKDNCYTLNHITVHASCSALLCFLQTTEVRAGPDPDVYATDSTVESAVNTVHPLRVITSSSHRWPSPSNPVFRADRDGSGQ